MIRHYYHVYADGAWWVPFTEHLKALKTITDPIDVTVGIVGSLENREEVLSLMPADWWYHEFDDGYEQQTLDLIFDLQDDDVVLYAHTKGAGNPSEINDMWRRCMTRHLVRGWRSALASIRGGADTVGVHWLTPEQYPDKVQIPFYGGNFWWATAAHIKRLPPPSHETRYHAEAWLGTVRPENPVDFQPGWPGAGCKEH